MNNPTISIVANFYKSERYISKLIKSVLNQTYSDWELICVNDCSPGKDAHIISKFVNHPKSNGRIRLINNKTNLGISKAKKVGIDNAKGKYITFIDGDDWLAPLALEKMIEPALKNNLDFVQMNSYRVYPFNIKKKCRNIVENYNTIINSFELIDKYYISFFGINLIGVAYWGKLIKTEIIKKIGFSYNNYPIGEDLLFNVHLFPFLKSAMFIDYYGYNWRYGGLTSTSACCTEIKQILFDFIEIFKIKKNFADKFRYSKAYNPMNIELKNILHSNLSSLAKYSINDNKANEIKELIREILTIDEYTNNIKKLLENENYTNNNFICAIAQKDVNTIYRICHEQYKLNYKRRFVKKCVFVLSKITN